MKRSYYSDSISAFLNRNSDEILGTLNRGAESALEPTQRDAWLEEMKVLRLTLRPFEGSIYLEYSIPRMGRRIDVVLLIGPVVFVLEFKVGKPTFALDALDQVLDYALDLKYFHEPSHQCLIAPVLVATGATKCPPIDPGLMRKDGIIEPIKTNAQMLEGVIATVLARADGPAVERAEWESGRYCPTPTIIEAALALYRRHSVEDISRSGADDVNLSRTSASISSIIEFSRASDRKSICFVTGVPGAGKTLVGLNLATKHMDKSSELYSVFLSGNGPLVRILNEALARDAIRLAKERGQRLRKGQAKSEVKAFIQNVHHYRDEYVDDLNRPPADHVVIFDEAQRAWNLEQTASFMRRKKGRPNFNQSEPEFLISCLDRHADWAVIVCLVGGGQEINTGEAGITEWVQSLIRSFPAWDVYISPHLTDSEYGADECLRALGSRPGVSYKAELHLGVSMRSFRAENVSLLVKQLLDLDIEDARRTLEVVKPKYPVVITRDLAAAKSWVKQHAQGSERFGIVVSSQAERLKPHAINIRAPLDPVHWFLEGKDDVRSSYFLEDAATEFDVQGLELDWTCVAWDADLRYSKDGWKHWSFRGKRWNRIMKEERRSYLKNAYRVLLTRARQGMVIVVPHGDSTDKTRCPEFYDLTFQYLREVGFATI